MEGSYKQCSHKDSGVVKAQANMLGAEPAEWMRDTAV